MAARIETSPVDGGDDIVVAHHTGGFNGPCVVFWGRGVYITLYTDTLLLHQHYLAMAEGLNTALDKEEL